MYSQGEHEANNTFSNTTNQSSVYNNEVKVKLCTLNARGMNDEHKRKNNTDL